MTELKKTYTSGNDRTEKVFKLEPFFQTSKPAASQGVQINIYEYTEVLFCSVAKKYTTTMLKTNIK